MNIINIDSDDDKKKHDSDDDEKKNDSDDDTSKIKFRNNFIKELFKNKDDSDDDIPSIIFHNNFRKELFKNKDDDEEIRIMGLKNIGNTCYLNVLIQILRTSKLYNIIKDIELENDNNKLIIYLKNVIYDLENNKKDDINKNLINFYKILCTKHKLLENIHEQHDPTEVFKIIIEIINEELKNTKYVWMDKNNFKCNYNDEINNNEWYKYIEKNNTIIHKLFSGLNLQTVTCDLCNNKTYYYDGFTSIELYIKLFNINKYWKNMFKEYLKFRIHQLDILLLSVKNKYIINKKKEDMCKILFLLKQKPIFSYLPISIKSLIKRYYSEEHITNKDELFSCLKCNKKVSYKKIYTCIQEPNILFCPIKQYIKLKNGKTARIKTNIILNNKISLTTQIQYELIGVIIHEGRLDYGGHYYNISKYDNKWYVCNDQMVSICENIHKYIKDKFVYCVIYKKNV